MVDNLLVGGINGALGDPWLVRLEIFNLKLPMKSRYKEVQQILTTFTAILTEYGFNANLRCSVSIFTMIAMMTVHLDLRHVKRASRT